MVFVTETGLDAEIWVNDEGVVEGAFGSIEVEFCTRQDLVTVFGEHQADEIMRQLLIISFGADARLVA